MNIILSADIRNRLLKAFPLYFINHNLEIIIHPKRNTYFLLTDVNNETDLKAKILEWLSREASKSIDNKARAYHMAGINEFLGTKFTLSDMEHIYTYLGNRINHDKTLRFIESGYNMAILQEAQ